MRILLIGNYAPPYEEENLHNISLLRRLEKDGHTCTALNVSPHPSVENGFIDAQNIAKFVFTLLQHCRTCDVVYFSTKGYLRVGLLKMMASIFAGKLFGKKTVVTFHSELFSVLGQMRSPFGGTQTLNTSFSLVDSIIYHDQDTFDVASMYKKKPNFELIPSFVQLPETDSESPELLPDSKKVIIFSNVLPSSFIFEIVTELLASKNLPQDTGIVISIPANHEETVQSSLEERAGDKHAQIVFVKERDLLTMFMAYARASVIVRPLSCDGETFFDDFSMSVKRAVRKDQTLFFPGGLALFKEGTTAEMCVDMICNAAEKEPSPLNGDEASDPYEQIRSILSR